jgi:hypothetical protein
MQILYAVGPTRGSLPVFDLRPCSGTMIISSKRQEVRHGIRKFGLQQWCGHGGFG